MDLTVLNLAIPALSKSLQPSSVQLLWIVDIYGFMVAGSLLIMGTLGDRIGRRKLLLIGATAFGLASLLAAFSTSAAMLIATRALLGIAGATLGPSTLSLIRNMFLDPDERMTAIGIWGTSFAVGGAIGPLIGGILLQYFWWGAVFLVPVPVMVLLLILGPILLPEYRDPNAGRLDILSAAMSLLAVLAVIFGVKQMAQNGLGWIPVFAMVVGVVIGFLFVRRQKTLADPLLDLRLFANRAFSASAITNTVAVFVAFGGFLYTAQYFQLVLGMSPLQAGLWSLPGAVAVIIVSNTVPLIARRVRPVYLIVTGLLFVSVGYGLLTQVGGDAALAILVTSNIIMSTGFGLIFTLTSDMIVGAAPVERAGSASAIAETGSEFGGALGIAILGTLGAAVYRTIMANTMPAGIPPQAAEVARDTLGGAVAVADKLPASLAASLLEASHTAFAQGFHVTAAVATFLMIATALLAMSMLRNVHSHSEVAEDTSAIANDETTTSAGVEALLVPATVCEEL
jgi:DHA2 family multidrug resistance protein-like MFS transporter